MAYDTGNPIGSTDARDLYDNAVNLDKAVNQSAARWTDRLGISRPSWSGITAYMDIGPYAAGIGITGYNEIFLHEGEYYRAAASTTLPYTTTGSWSDDGVYFVSVGDAVLRQELETIADTVIGPYRNAVNCNQYGGLQLALSDSDTLGKVIIVTDDQSITDDVTVINRAIACEFSTGIITIASNKTLTINGPFQCGLFQCFDGDGSVVFGSGAVTEVYPEWWGVDGVDDVLEVRAACNSTQGVVNLGTNTYYFASRVPIESPVTVIGGTINVGALSGGFYVTSSNVTFDNVVMIGSQYTTRQSSEIAIECLGASSAEPVDNLIIRNCTFTDFGFAAIWGEHVTNFTVVNNKIANMFYAGILFLSGIGGEIRNNTVHNIIGPVNAYGIQVTRREADSVVDYPNSENVTMSGNIVSSIPAWEGIGSHGGIGLVISDNTILGCKVGVSLVPAEVSNQVSTFAPKNCVITNNYIDSTVTDGSFNDGIRIAGASGVEYGSAVISNNVIVGHGGQYSAVQGAITARDTDSLVISSNIIREPSSYGIILNINNLHVNITDNIIVDPWSNTQAVAGGIRVVDNINNAVIRDNFFARGTKTASAVFTVALSVANKTVSISYKNNFSEHTGVYEVVDAGYKCVDSVFKGSKTYDPASMATMTGTSTTVSVPNAKLGDAAVATFSLAIPAGVLVSAVGTANDTVTVSFFNSTSGTVDLASGTLSVIAMRL